MASFLGRLPMINDVRICSSLDVPCPLSLHTLHVRAVIYMGCIDGFSRSTSVRSGTWGR